MPGLAQQPLQSDAPVLNDDALKQHWLETPMYTLEDDDGIRRLVRTYAFDSHTEALGFLNRVSRDAEACRCHPKITAQGAEVSVMWQGTNGLTQNEFIMAARSDAAYLAELDANRSRSPVSQASEESFPASDPPGWIGNTQEVDANAAPDAPGTISTTRSS